LISKTKIIRDLVIIVIIVVVGVLAWHLLNKSHPDSSSDASQIMSKMQEMPTVEGDGSEFELDNPEIAIKVDGVEYSIGDIDKRADTHFRMISMGKMGLTKDLRSEARRNAVLSLRREAVIEKAMKDFNVDVTDAEVESMIGEIKKSLTEQGSLKEFLDQMGITEDQLRARLKKDEIENKLFLAFIEKSNLKDSETTAQQEAFSKWIDDQIQSLEFEVLGSFLEELSPPASGGMNGSPHGMGGMPPVNPDSEGETSEGNPTDKQGN
jgi:hypothetical protein